METKQKVNVADIIARSNEKSKEVKSSTEKVAAKTNDFKIIPGFGKYEFNGVICRNIKTKSIMSLKKSNQKFQLINDEGKNIDKSPAQLKELVAVSIPEKVKAPKKEKAIKQPKVKVAKVAGEKKQSIMFLVNLMFHQGEPKEKILEKLGISNKKYLDCQWHYANKGYKSKIVKFLKEQTG